MSHFTLNYYTPVYTTKFGIWNSEKKHCMDMRRELIAHPVKYAYRKLLLNVNESYLVLVARHFISNDQ